MLKRFWPLLTVGILVVLAAVILPATAALMPKHPRFHEQTYLTEIALGTSLVNFPHDVKVGEPFEVYGQLSYLARGLFAVPLTRNFRAFLKGESEIAEYRKLPLCDLANYWRERWLMNRKQNGQIIERVKAFLPEHFTIVKTTLD